MVEQFIQLYNSGDATNRTLAKELIASLELNESNAFIFCDFYIALSPIDAIDLNSAIVEHQPDLIHLLKYCVDNYEYNPAMLKLLSHSTNPIDKFDEMKQFVRALKRVKNLPLADLKVILSTIRSELKQIEL